MHGLDRLMFHGRDGARMPVLCLGYLSCNGHSSGLSIPKEEDSAFPAGVVAGDVGETPGCQTPKKKKVDSLIPRKVTNVLRKLPFIMHIERDRERLQTF